MTHSPWRISLQFTRKPCSNHQAPSLAIPYGSDPLRNRKAIIKRWAVAEWHLHLWVYDMNWAIHNDFARPHPKWWSIYKIMPDGPYFRIGSGISYPDETNILNLGLRKKPMPMKQIPSAIIPQRCSREVERLLAFSG